MPKTTFTIGMSNRGLKRIQACIEQKKPLVDKLLQHLCDQGSLAGVFAGIKGIGHIQHESHWQRRQCRYSYPRK